MIVASAIELFSRDWSIRDENEPIQNMNSRSFRRLRQLDVDEVERIAEPTLAKHG